MVSSAHGGSVPPHGGRPQGANCECPAGLFCYDSIFACHVGRLRRGAAET
ncbi:hypothetical protein B005_1993 [Nocardiopsis alba ATCC BAA-2165]|uniref:Uncharacterized protein n=1 Tax=Nocardiopsis alba (strain ATCC BAA-2165 / BE74) TaxID=1205910 RepID=J7L0H5_NOCAA|nr:hypothetical protein B005_1993 [Nocardiopsis alba ATCC BAA-2165]